VQADRAEHRFRERRPQERQRHVLVQVVLAAQRRRLAAVVDQVADVVQQRGADQLGAAPSCSARCALCSACSSWLTPSPS
jgi:hypothetical protein